MSDIIEKISKVLHQAENAKTPAEADAFLAAAQMLSTKYSIDLAVARSHTAKKEQIEVPVRRSVNMDEAGRNNKKPLVNLYRQIAFANDLMLDIAHDSTRVYPYGYPSDLDVTEAIFVHLATQMIDAANKYIASGEYKKETKFVTVRYKDFDDYDRDCYDRKSGRYFSWRYKDVEKPVDGRVARSNFYSAFARRIGERLRAASSKAEAQVIAEDTSSGTELALIDKRKEVGSFYKTKTNARGSWKGSSTSSYVGSAQTAGHKAGSNARIGAQGSVSGGGKELNA